MSRLHVWWFRCALMCCCAMTLRAGAIAEEPANIDLPSRIKQSLKLLSTSADTYIRERQCFSCHHQALPVMTLSLAGSLGQDVDASVMRRQSEFTIKYFAARRDSLVKGNGVPGGSYSAGYALVSLAADKWPADETTTALVDYLFHRQQSDGQWAIQTHRPPLEDSDFTATALAVRAIHLWATPERLEETLSRAAQAVEWLRTAETKTHEDRVFQVLGLHWAEAWPPHVKEFAAQLVAQQRSDGGWSQLDTMASDAYATGQALAALAEVGGLKASDEAYRRGVAFLLKTQQEDGSWQVTSRSKPFQTYFESGYPHGKNQFISICAGSWATMALIRAGSRSLDAPATD